ncbi:hypothetical protein Tco_0854176 [Tanacetum coccineum]
MADAEHALAMAPPVRTDEQILPRIRWVPIRKSNCYLNEEKSQPSPIFKIVVDILKQTNFFRAFTASSTIPAIYIQQFRDTICFDSKAGSYKCQLDEQWFDLTQDTLRDALQITPVDKNWAFSPPPTPDTLIEFVNELGYPREVINLSNVTTNDMFQPWRALTTIINLCLTGKTSGFERPRAPVLQILWGVVNRAHIDYAERMWEEFTQSIHNFTEDKRNLAQQAQGKKKATIILIPSIRFTKLIIFHLQRLHNFHPRPESPLHLPTEEPVLEAPPLAKRAKAGKVVKKRTVKSSKQLVDEFVDEGVPAAKPNLEDTEEAILQKVLEESLTDAYPTRRGPLPPVVFREPDTGKLQPLPEVPGKGKEKVGEEQAAQVLLHLQTTKKKSPTEQYIFQRHTPVPSEPAGHEESSSLYAELGLYGSDTESDEEMPSVVRSGAQDEGQAGPDPGTLDEGQAGPNPDDVAESQPLPTPSVLAGPNLEHSDVEITDPSSQPQPEHMDEGFTAAAYPDVQENLKLTVDEQVIPEEPVSSTGTLSSLQHLAKDFSFGDQFLNDKPSEADNEKTTADTEAESMVSVTIQQDTSVIPPMTSPVIGPVPRPDSPNVHWPLPTTTTTTATTTTTLPLPPQPQQVEENQALETRLDKQGSRINKLENMDLPKMIREQTVEFIDSQEIDRKINESVKEVVISSVKHAMRAPLRARFKDLPMSDMKEILLQRMLEENYDKGHAAHRIAYEALQDSIRRDECEDFDVDKAQEETKKKSKQDSPKTPPGSPPLPPPPPPPPSGASGASGTTEDFQLGIESYQTQLNLTKPRWDATGFEFKHDYTVIDSPRAVTFRDRYGVQMILRFNEIHKFSDGTLQQIDEALDYRVKEFRVNRTNPGMNTRFWTQKDFVRSKEFMFAIQKWLKTRRIFQNLESFVVGRIRAGDYRWKNCHKLLTDKGMMHSTVQCSSTSTWVVKPATRYLIRSGLKRESASFDIAAMYGISHWWFQRQRFYIDRFSSEGDRKAVRTHMRILTRIESYPNELNLTKPQWAAPDLSSSMDYIVIGILQGQLHSDDRYGRVLQMIMRFNEIHKFSDGTLQQIDEALDYRVKEFRGQTGKSRDEYKILDAERRCQKQGVHVKAIQQWLKTRRHLPEILLKINLPDHRSVLTDPEDQVMVEIEIPRSSEVNSQPHAHT